MASSSLTVMTFFLLVTVYCSDGAAITCGGVLTIASPCVSYVQKGGQLPPGCCDAIRRLNDATRTTADLQIACGCLKTLLPSVGAKADLVNGLPVKCGIEFPYRYSPSMDCSQLHR